MTYTHSTLLQLVATKHLLFYLSSFLVSLGSKDQSFNRFSKNQAQNISSATFQSSMKARIHNPITISHNSIAANAICFLVISTHEKEIKCSDQDTYPISLLLHSGRYTLIVLNEHGSRHHRSDRPD